jgi:hypothetical protein
MINFSDLRPKQQELLRSLLERNAPIPVDEVDGRVLRPLRSHGLVAEREGQIRVTGIARNLHLPSQSSLNPAAIQLANGDRESPLSKLQEETLRHLCRQSGAVPVNHLDGRVVRALKVRALIQESDEWVSPTDAGRTYYETHGRRRRRVSRGSDPSRTARAEAIQKALDALELAVPKDVEIRVGDATRAYADDVISGFREFARTLGSTGAG